MPTNSSTAASPSETMSSPTEQPQKTDPVSTSTSNPPTSSTTPPPPPPPTSSSSHSSTSSPPPPPPSSSPPPSSPPTKSPPPQSTPPNSPNNPPPTSPTGSPSGGSSNTPSETSPTPDPAPSSSIAGPVNNVTSGVAETTQGSPNHTSLLAPPRGAPVTAISTVIITTQAGGRIVTLTTTLPNPTLSSNNNVTGQHSGVNTHAIAAASVIGGLAVLSVAAWGLFAYRRKRQRAHIERDSTTAAMVAAGVLPPPFVNSPNLTPRVERASQHYFEDGTPITSVLEHFNPYAAYPAVGPRTSSNGTTTPSANDISAAKRSPSERSAVVPPIPLDESRSHSPPNTAGAYPPAAFNNLRRSMRSSYSSSSDSHSQGHTSLVIPQQQPQSFVPMFSPPLVPSVVVQSHMYPHTYYATTSPAGSSPPGSGNSHDEHEALIPARDPSQQLSRTHHDVLSTANSQPSEREYLMGTPAGIPVSSSEISIGFGDSEGYGSTLLSRPRLEVRNRTGSFVDSETSKNDN